MYVKLGSAKVTAITDGGLSFREGAYDRHMRPVFAIEVFGHAPYLHRNTDLPEQTEKAFKDEQ